MRKTMIMLTGIIAAFTVVGCAKYNVVHVNVEKKGSEENVEDETKEGKTGLANPWSDISPDEEYEVMVKGFNVPEGAENVKWSKMDGEDESVLVQVTFDHDGNSYVAREQITDDEKKDISGMYYEWTESDDAIITLSDGRTMSGMAYRYVGDDEYVDLITWYDSETGISYSLTTTAADLDGFDIQGVAEAMFVTADQGAQYISDPDHEPFDISGCDTLEQIIDKLPAGYAYAKTNIEGTDMLFITEDASDYDGTGNYVSKDADIFCMEDGVLSYMGFVDSSDGDNKTIPLTVNDDRLYVASIHELKKLVPADGKLMIEEEIIVERDPDGKGKYVYHSYLQDAGEAPEEELNIVVNELYDKVSEGEKVSFELVK